MNLLKTGDHVRLISDYDLYNLEYLNQTGIVLDTEDKTHRYTPGFRPMKILFPNEIKIIFEDLLILI